MSVCCSKSQYLEQHEEVQKCGLYMTPYTVHGTQQSHGTQAVLLIIIMTKVQSCFIILRGLQRNLLCGPFK
jgi:hypothetical protein